MSSGLHWYLAVPRQKGGEGVVVGPMPEGQHALNIASAMRLEAFQVRPGEHPGRVARFLGDTQLIERMRNALAGRASGGFDWPRDELVLDWPRFEARLAAVMGTCQALGVPLPMDEVAAVAAREELACEPLMRLPPVPAGTVVGLLRLGRVERVGRA